MRTPVTTKLSLKKGPKTEKASSGSDSPTGQRRERVSHPAYKDLGQIIRFLKKGGFKVRWHKPLSKSIYHQIRAVLPIELMSSRKLYDAIGFHVKSVRYLMRLKAGDSRFNIKGQREGKVSSADETYARKALIEHHPRFMSWKRKTKNKIITATKPARRPPHGK